MSTRFKILSAVIAISFVAIISLGVIEMRAIENTIAGWDLMRNASLFGLVLGVGTSLFFQKKYPSKEAVPTLRIWLASLMVFLFLVPVLAGFLNRNLGGEKIEVAAEFLEEKPILAGLPILSENGSIKPEGYHLFVFIDGKIQRFTKTNPCCLEKEKGEIINLKLNKGALGYNYAER